MHQACKGDKRAFLKPPMVESQECLGPVALPGLQQCMSTVRTCAALPASQQCIRISSALLQGGGVRVNNDRVSSDEHVLSEEDLIEGRLVLLAAGKKNKMLVRVK